SVKRVLTSGSPAAWLRRGLNRHRRLRRERVEAAGRNAASGPSGRERGSALDARDDSALSRTEWLLTALSGLLSGLDRRLSGHVGSRNTAAGNLLLRLKDERPLVVMRA